ncbi:MAG: SDR family oxidoreductase [Fimbriimonadia bacterium]|nr:SDR family oxidoreductase [Fimbriimonadia bacterium]
MSLEGQSILVTGASRGIGRAIAQSLAESGALIGVHYCHQLEAARETLNSLPNHQPHFLLQGDLSEPDTCQRLIEHTLEQAGRINALVNNAGIYRPVSFHEPDADRWRSEWQHLFQTNFFSAVDLSYWACQAMRSRSGGGKILHIASRAGFRGEAGYSHYAASKAALINFTRSMAVELAQDNIQTFCIAPGWVETDMAEEGLRAYGERIRTEVPLGRVASPNDVANVARFLLSPESDYLSGVTIDVNGGSYFH